MNENEVNEYITQEEMDIELKTLQQEELENRMELEDRLKTLVSMQITLLVPAIILTILLMIYLGYTFINNFLG